MFQPWYLCASASFILCLFYGCGLSLFSSTFSHTVQEPYLHDLTRARSPFQLVRVVGASVQNKLIIYANSNRKKSGIDHVQSDVDQSLGVYHVRKDQTKRPDAIILR